MKIALIIATFIIFPEIATACKDHYFFSIEQLGEIRSNNYIGDAPTSFSLGHRWQLNEHWYGGLIIRHQSNVDRGAPINGKNESRYDGAGFTLEGRF